MNPRFQGWVGTALLWCLAAGAASGDSLLPPMTNGTASDFAARRSGASVNASRRIEISRAGLYRITYGNLVASGVSNVVGSQVRLFCRTQEIALATTTEGAWSSGDYAVFYGWPHDGYYTTNNVYWLGIAPGGLRMATRSSAPIAATDVTTHWDTVRYDRDAVFIPTYFPQVDTFDHWVAFHRMTNGDYSFTMITTNRLGTGTSGWRFALWGQNNDPANTTDHVTTVKVNGTVITNFIYDGLTYFGGTTTVAATSLSNGANTVVLREQSGASVDFAALEWAEATYLASNRPVQEALSFTGRSGTNNYFSAPWVASNGLWLLDLTDIYHPVRLTNFAVQSVSGGYSLRWSDVAVGSNVYFACSTSQISTVSTPTQTYFRGLSDTNRQADYVIICDYSMRTNVYRLAKYRVKNGLRVVVAPITDVYNEFSYGIKDAAAIKQFLGYVYHHWAVHPATRYVLLVGDASSDPRNLLGTSGGQDIVPVHLGPTTFEYSGQDAWYVTVKAYGGTPPNDYLPDMALGRIPVTTDVQLSNFVAKLVDYEVAVAVSNTWQKKALVVADRDADLPDLFKDASDTNVFAQLLTNGFTVTKAYLGFGIPSAASMRTAITNGINGGVFAVSYFGHGFTDIWSTFFDTNDVAKLTNNIWPAVNVLTCDNGDFDNPAAESLGEALLERPRRGAIAVTAAGSLSDEFKAEAFAYGYYASLANTQNCYRISDAMDAAYLRLWLSYSSASELLFYTLLGDPATVVNP